MTCQLLQLQEEWSSRLALERKKLTQELFELEARLRTTEATLQDTVAADRNKADTIREMSNQHRSEVEAIQCAARLSSKQQVGTHSHTDGIDMLIAMSHIDDQYVVSFACNLEHSIPHAA